MLILVLLLLVVHAVSKEDCPPTEGYPKVVIGTWMLLERYADVDKAVDTLQEYVRAGFTSFDTADIYGQSESILGLLQKKEPSKDLQFYTKYVTGSSDIGEARRVNSQSRAALGRIPDLVQFHWWDYSDTAHIVAAKHLQILRNEGLVEKVALCNYDTFHTRQIVEEGVLVYSNQVQYSLVDRRPENGMLAFAKANGIRLACFGTVAGGLLSDRYLGKSQPDLYGRGQSTVSQRMYFSNLERWSGGNWALFQELLRTLRQVADKHSTTIANVAAAWVLYQLGGEGGESGGWVILGVRDAKHLDEHKDLLSVTLDAEDDETIQQVLVKGNNPVGDIWSYERAR